ncbi:fibronectin type III domain-containing protein [Candidatus Gracilibacteria bacterium]|nr:fibronectin type III domain-containing protein [Candidatus Gracilibacteria bacterium]MCF7856315.1 fibronectin type III domain-containing protein [Candidatus Gracilibacteria bacterium]MCF7896670.1 fibronectin type III domain-containing protein [Candidatus Gracilibacteria bacterium]
MEKLNPETKKKSAWKAFGGGIAALGIFASLLVLGNFDFSEIGTLRAEVLATTPTAAITLLNPTTGETGDLIQLTVENLADFEAETGGIFFGEIPATIDTISAGGADETLITVEVPAIEVAGEYMVKITTPTGMLESPTRFSLLTTTNEVATIPLTIDLPTSPEINLEDSSSFLEAEPVATSFENNFYSEAQTPKRLLRTSEIVSPPQKLKVNSTLTGIQLSWQKPTTGKAETFNIYYGSRSGNYLHRINSKNFAEIISQNLEGGKIYLFAVKSVDAFGNESPASNEVSAIFAAESTKNPTSNFHPAASRPPQLSEQGPAASLAIALLITLAITFFSFRKKIWAGK